MAKHRHLAGRLRSTRGWRRRIGWAIVTVLALGVAGFIYLSRPQRLAHHAADLLQRISGAEAEIELAHLSLTGEIELEHVSLRVPGTDDNAGKLFEAERVVIRPDLASLITGRFNAKTIVMLRPVVYLTEYAGREDLAYNFQLLADEFRDDDKKSIPRLPAIFVRHGTVRFNVIEDGDFRTLDHIQLDGRLNESDQEPGSYSFALRQQTDGDTPGPQLFGRFNLQEQTVRVELEDFAFDQPQRNFLPKRLRAWWDRFSPRGELSSVVFSYSPDGGLDANLSMEHGEMTLLLGDGEFESRMTDVSVNFDIRGGIIKVAGLTGEIEGIRYRIDGRWDGFEPQAPFDVSATTEPFQLAEEPRFVFGLPSYIREQYERFRPSGTFSAQVHVRRAEHAGPIAYDGRVELIDVKGRYFRFPYPLEHVSGAIEFDDTQVTLSNLTGRGLTGAMVSLEGKIAPPGNEARVEVNINITGLPVDEHLTRAMKDKDREVLETFFHADSHRRLVEAGLIRSTNPKLLPFTPERFAIENPAQFDLGGTVDAEVRLLRPPGPDQRYHTGLLVDVGSVNVLFKHWNYPFEIASGRVVIDGGKSTVRKLALRGPSGATALVDGTIEFIPGADGRGPKVVPDLNIISARLPLDEYLFASIPPPRDLWVRDLHLSGSATASGHIGTDDNGVTFRIDAEAQDAAATPFGGALSLTGITGKLVLAPTGVQLENVECAYGSGQIKLTGQADWSGQQPTVTAKLTGTNLSISRDMLDLIPPEQPQRRKIVELFDTYQPEGRFDTQIAFTGGVTGRDFDYAVALRPHRLAFTYDDQRLALTRMAGQITVRPDLIELSRVKASTSDGTFAVNGFVRHGSQRGASLTFSAEARQIDKTTRALLPDAGRTVLDALGVEAGYRITEGRVVTRPDTPEGPVLEFESLIELTDASAEIGLPVRDLHGQLGVRVVQFAKQAWPYVEVRLDAEHLYAADRLVRNLGVELSTGEQRHTLVMTECEGEIYGGALIGAGLVEMGRSGFYRFDLRVHDADVDPFIYPDEYPIALSTASQTGVDVESDLPPGAAPLKDQQADTGNLSASIVLEADLDDPMSRRGRGAMEIEDARLFEQPLSLALLQAANFNLPTTRSFDRASARFIIDGNMILFDEVRMESPNFALIGDGTLDFPTRRLNLTLNTREVGGFRLGALSEMIDVFKDELVSIRVTGTIDDPQANAVPLISLRRSWQAGYPQDRRTKSDLKPASVSN